MGREAKYVVKLDEAERDSLQRLVDGGKGSKESRRRARVLLKADEAEGLPHGPTSGSRSSPR